MIKKYFVLSVLLFFVFSLSLAALDVKFYLAPNGGFSPFNNQRTITLKDGKVIPATLNNGVYDLVQRTPVGGVIKIVMYNFDYKLVYDEVIKRALNDNVQVKVILDNAAGWTGANVKKFVDGVKTAENKARKEGKSFDFQVKVCTKKSFEVFRRCYTLNTGKKIFGTMHEKFGVFYDDRSDVPVHSFIGSSNISKSSDDTFAENRMFFLDAPVISRVFANQFARLWNYYTVARAGIITPERIYPISRKPVFETVFNMEHTDSLLDYKYNKIDERILKLLDTVKRNGSVDLAMFSFTHRRIANKIIELARKYPRAKFRLLFDHSMIEAGPERIGLMAPVLEGKIKELKLKNIEIRYKFRTNAYGWNKETKKIELDHFRSPILHHKVIIVNKNAMIFGSYNYSGSAEVRNTENIVVVKTDNRFGKDVIKRFLLEYDFLWNRRFEDETCYKPYVIAGPLGREMQKQICETLTDFGASKLRYLLDRYGPKTIRQLIRSSKMTRAKVIGALGKLRNAKLIKSYKYNKKRYYALFD